MALFTTNLIEIRPLRFLAKQKEGGGRRCNSSVVMNTYFTIRFIQLYLSDFFGK